MRPLALLLLVLATGAAGAQEFDIFELSDFVDPRVRGAAFAPDGWRTAQSGNPFLVSRISLGAISDYYWRTTPTGANVGVLHKTTSLYWGANQLNLKLTHLKTRNENALLPTNRGVIQFARYTARPDRSAQAKDGPPAVIVSRYLFGMAMEESPDVLENSEGHRAMNYELAAELDVRLPLTDFLGTVSYVKRFAGEGQSTERVAYVYHTGHREYRQVAVDMNLAVGAEKTNGWRWGDVRPIVHLRVPIDKVGTVLHAAYAPTVSFEGGFEVRHEVALFLDRAIFARVFSRAGNVP